ncbi:MAG: Holliday junction branch migration protein RuvA [Thermacetogeniaceae bacterium]
MISFLRGTLVGVEENRIVVDVHGVGYEISVPAEVLRRFSRLGEEVEIYTHLYVREDSLQLFGFASAADRDLFRLLLKTQGIGPRVALTILDTFSREEFVELVSRGDTRGLLRIPGIGKKSAERLVLELKDRLSGYLRMEEGTEGETAAVYQEVSDALLALGYSRSEAVELLKKMRQKRSDGACSANEILREALKELGKGKRE